MLTLQNISVLRGNKLLFDKVNLAFYAGQKIGVVGRNGCGKSSLFALILGELSSNSGEVSLAGNVKIGYVEQEIPTGTRQVLDYVIDVDVNLREVQQRLVKAEQEGNGEAIAHLYAQIEDMDGFTAKARAAKLLDGLGFNSQQMEAKVNELSGGWRVRLNLARALMSRSDILLLDEPTNHLDLDAVVWLESWLKKYPGLLLIISHDREFLDNIVEHVAHIDNGTIRLYSGNYTQFEKTAAEQAILQQKMYAKQQKQREHLQSFVDRFRAKATKARQAQSRIKALQRMEDLAPIYAKLPFTFKFLTPDKMPHSLLHMEHVDFGYLENQIVLQNVEFNVEAHMRAALLGRNGAGKSTLIKLLAGELQPQGGILEVNSDLKVGYFAQYALDNLREDLTPLGNLKAVDKSAAAEKVLRSFLGGFLFSGDKSLQEVGTLSGGEKARLCLAMLVWQKPNLLLLDEPTNHLDMDMREALLLALQDFSGAVILVSHDRYLVDSAVDDLYLVHDKEVAHYSGDLHEYQRWLLSSKSQLVQDTTSDTIDATQEEKVLSYADRKLVKSLESKLEKLAVTMQKIDLQLADPDIYNQENQDAVQKLLDERVKLQRQIESLEEKWLGVCG